MKKTYRCPHCKGVLNPNNKVVVIAKSATQKGLVLLDEQPGEYNYIKDPTLVFEEHEKLTMECPICHAELTSASRPGCSEVLLEEGEKAGTVYFANNNGEHATCIVWSDFSMEAYGEHKESYFANMTIDEQHMRVNG